MEVGGPRAAHHEQFTFCLSAGSAGCESHSGPCWGERGCRCRRKASRLSGLFHDDVFDVPDDSHCRDHDPDDPRAVVEIGFRVDEKIGEIIFISVVVAPPDESAIADISVVVVDELCACHVFDPCSERLFNIVVPTKFLDHLPGFKSELY